MTNNTFLPWNNFNNGKHTDVEIHQKGRSLASSSMSCLIYLNVPQHMVETVCVFERSLFRLDPKNYAHALLLEGDFVCNFNRDNEEIT